MWATLVLVAVAVAVTSLLQTPAYEASAEVLVGWRQGDRPDNPTARGEALSLTNGLEGDVELLVRVIDTRPVAEETVRRVGSGMPPGELLDTLTVEQIRGTSSIRITYRGTDPEAAEQIADEFATVSSERISESTVAHRGFTATLVRRATVPEEPAGTNPVRDGLLTLAVGLALIWGAAEAIPMARRRRAARSQDGTRTS